MRISEFYRRLHYRLNRRRCDAELEADMELHREMASSAGRQNFGNMLRLKEEAREAWGWMWVDRLGQDLRYGLHVMARSPGFTLTAVLVLAIGIGVNVSAFSLFDMLALKSMPVRDPDSLVRLERRSPDSSSSEMAYPSFLFYREHASTLSAAIAVLGVPPIQINDDLQRTSSSFVTSNYFAELGTKAAYGRMLDPALDNLADASPVAVIGYGLWQRRFAGDLNVIGRTIYLNRKPVTIVGITPDALATLGGQNPDIWLPIAQQPYLFEGSKVLNDFNDSSVRMWGRLAPGATAAAAEGELLSLTDALRQQHRTAVWDKEFIQSSPGGHLQVMQPGMYQIAAIVGVLTLLILAVACGNLGALLLARAVQREHEIGIRLAIGANSLRIFRQLCTESLLLAGIGSAAGLAFGCVVLRIALTQLNAPKWLSALPDWRVLLFTVAMSLVSAISFGLTPALQIARQRQHKATARQILVTAQVAGSCVLLIVAGLLVRAAHRGLYTNPGFGYERLVSIDPQLARHGYSIGGAEDYFDRLQARLLSVPGVRSVSLVLLPPLGHTVSRSTRIVNGHTVTVYPNWVAPGFFQTMQIPILLGRTFRPGEKNAVIVSLSFAREQWHGQNPLGQLLGDEKSKDTVVGVVGDAHLNALSDNDALEQYWPVEPGQKPSLVLMARTVGAMESLPTAARSLSESLDPKLFPEIRPIRALYRQNMGQVEQLAGVVTLMGFAALALAGVGLIGLVSFTVWQKTKEIAIRTALGAGRGSILNIVLRQFCSPVLVGLFVGAGIAAAASRLLRHTLYGISNLDPTGYGGAIGVLLAVLLIAALLPASRALRVNVAKALHYD